jgi:hypothetical protein
VASTNPVAPQHPRTPASPGPDAARTSDSSGTRANQASHHHDGAGNASAGSAPATKAAAAPRTRLGFADGDTKSTLGRGSYEKE